MEDRRLRKRFGMVVCKMVLRSTAETTSAHPATPSRTRAIQRVSVKPKAAMANPQTTTARMTARPWRRVWLIHPVIERRSRAPAPGAA